MSVLKKADHIPDFASEEEERIFRETHDSAEAVDWSLSTRARFPNLVRNGMQASARKSKPRHGEP